MLTKRNLGCALIGVTFGVMDLEPWRGFVAAALMTVAILMMIADDR